MGILNVLRAQATHLVKDPEKVKELTGKVKEKAEDFQAKRKADAVLVDLGRLHYAEQTGRAAPGAETETARLLAKLRIMEDEGVPLLPPVQPPAAPDVPDAGTPSSPPPEG